MTNDNSKTQESFNSGKVALIAILSIISSAIFFGLSQAIPHFKTTFESFGSEVPALTKIIIDLSQIYLPLAIFSFTPIVSLLMLRKSSLQLGSFIIKLAVTIFSFASCYFIVSFIAMYLPIVELNNVKS
jgi:type II secretory pathway component PulF